MLSHNLNWTMLKPVINFVKCLTSKLDKRKRIILTMTMFQREAECSKKQLYWETNNQWTNSSITTLLCLISISLIRMQSRDKIRIFGRHSNLQPIIMLVSPICIESLLFNTDLMKIWDIFGTPLLSTTLSLLQTKIEFWVWFSNSKLQIRLFRMDWRDNPGVLSPCHTLHSKGIELYQVMESMLFQKRWMGWKMLLNQWLMKVHWNFKGDIRQRWMLL